MDAEGRNLETTAARYVLGVMRDVDRDIFEARLLEDVGLQRLVGQWQDLLAPMSALVSPLDPPVSLWPQIQRSLRLGSDEVAVDHRPPPAAAVMPPPAPVDNRYSADPGPPPRALNALAPVSASATQGQAPDDVLRLLRRWCAGAVIFFAVSVLLAFHIATRTLYPVVVDRISMSAVLAPIEAAPVWSIHYDQGANQLLSDAVSPGAELRDQVYELWALPPNGGPVSLGFLPAGRQIRLIPSANVARYLAGGMPLAVTLEPSGGAPSGVPTGQIVHTGRLERHEPPSDR